MGARWTSETDRLLLRLAADGLGKPFMAERLGRSVDSITQRLHGLQNPAQAEVKRQRKAAYMAAYEARSKAGCIQPDVPGRPTLDAVMIARITEAQSLRHRDLTGSIMGDPLLGRSALDNGQ